MDPLRAPFVAHLDGAFRYYCSRDCHARRVDASPSRRPPAAARLVRAEAAVPPAASRELDAHASTIPASEPRDAAPPPAPVFAADEAEPAAPPVEPARFVAEPLARSAVASSEPRTALEPAPERPSVEHVAAMLGLTRDSLPAELRGEGAAPRSGDEARDAAVTSAAPATHDARRSGADAVGLPAVDPAAPVVALGAAALAALVAAAVGVLPDLARALLAGVCAAINVGVAAREVARQPRRGDWVLALAPPVVLLALATRAESAGALSSRLASAAALAAVVPVVAWVARARVRRAHARIAALVADLPRTARVVRGAGAAATTEVLVASRVRAGEEVAVEAGELVPVDGVVRGGQGLAVMHAGSSTARPCGEGDAVLAGARVVEGALRVLATRAGDDVSLARLPRMVGAAAEPPRTVRLAERGAAVLPLAAGAVAAAGAVVHGLNGGGDPLGVAAVALAAAPCALTAALARVPFVDAAARAAARGIVFRDAPAIEAAAGVGTVVLCVRGTVTMGRLELVDVVSLGSRSERELIAVGAAAEDVARGQPIARAVAEMAQKRGVVLESVRRPALLAGRGITAINAAGESVAIGSRQLLLAEGVSVAPAEDVARAIEGQGRTAVFIAIAGRVEGVFGLEDPLRDDARPAVQAMMDAGFDLALLAGESRGTVEAIGLALDVANVRPEVSPDERAAAVRAIGEVANAVAVVGRPARDGAALGAADVAISLAAAGGAGGETAVALASDDLRDAAAALALARKGRDRALATVATTAGGALAASALCAFVPGVGALGALAAASAVAAVAFVSTRE